MVVVEQNCCMLYVENNTLLQKNTFCQNLKTDLVGVVGLGEDIQKPFSKILKHPQNFELFSKNCFRVGRSTLVPLTHTFFDRFQNFKQFWKGKELSFHEMYS